MLDRDAATKYIHELLQLMVNSRGSDLFITAEFPPAIKVDGKVTPISQQPLTTVQAMGLVKAIMNEKQLREYEDSFECNFAITAPTAGRFRVSAFMQQGRAGMVLRTINTKIPTLTELDLPPILNEVAMSKRGLVVVVGRRARASRPRWRRWSATATRIRTATSSPSKTRWNTCTHTTTAS